MLDKLVLERRLYFGLGRGRGRGSESTVVLLVTADLLSEHGHHHASIAGRVRVPE